MIQVKKFYATWCGPCIEEIGELQKLSELLKSDDKLNMITICSDYLGQEDVAKKILKMNNASFITLIPDEIISQSVLKDVQLLPTTIFVDSDGKVVGNLQEGVPSGDVVNAYMKLINEQANNIK